MESLIDQGRAAFRLLFAYPDPGGALKLQEEEFLPYLDGLLHSLDAPGRPGQAGTADYCNMLGRCCGAQGFETPFFGALFESFVRHHIDLHRVGTASPGEEAEFLLDEALALIRLLIHLPSLLPEFGVFPRARKLFAGLDSCTDRKSLGLRIAGADRFAVSRVFRFVQGKFIPVQIESAKELDKFFGFPSVRNIFRDHFRRFSIGETNIPLLIHSLPGYGKTSMTVSFALAVRDAVLILPDPDALEENWHALMTPLSARSDRKFVVFFDDIDSRKVDWYNFRTHVGGAFILPENIMTALSSNFEFPPSILSRGRRISYPVFDEVRCIEMVEDFLRDFGLKSVPRNLVSLIAADYTEEFGQKKFTELSPRTLMRYLSVYTANARKRRNMVELAMGPMVTKPDPELFYEFNIELMRSLYGEEYIQRLLKERLRNL